MFKGLFKSKWKSDSVEKRLSYIADTDGSISANQTILEKLASNDVDAKVRQAAMAKISDPQTLFNLWQSKSDNQISVLAETAFRNRIQSESDFSEADFKAFITKNPSSKLVMAKYCPTVEIRNEILTSLSESEQADVISDIPYSMTRVMLAEKLQNIDSLEVARKNLKGKDKSAEKIIKAKIDAYHAQQKLELENAALATSICEKMEALARYVQWSDEIKVKFFSLSKSWDALDFDPSAEEQALYAEAFTKVEADVKHNLAIILSQQSQEKIVASLETRCEKIAAYPLDTLLLKNKEITEELNDLSWQLSKESETIPYSSNIHERFIKAKKAIETAISISDAVRESREINNDEDNRKEVELVNSHAKAILLVTSQVTKGSAWPNNYPELESANEAKLEADALLNATRDARKEAKDSLDNLHKRINRVFGAAKRGDVNRAQRELALVTKSASQYEGSDRKKLDERIEELTLEVRKMGDWKDFAIEPKLVDLCEQMEALPELERQSKNPSADKLAKKIKTLQDTWKALGSSDITDTYWPRFKEAGDKAYEPCAEFFKQRLAIQKDNLEKRESFVSQMKKLFESTDWDAKPDFKAIEDSVSKIMQSWKKIKDVERGPGQKQWEQLAKFKDQINEKLDIEYDKNIAAKQALTKQFEQMLEEEVNEQALDKLKFIQSKWKQIGVTRHKYDQIEWVKFKAASDAVYEKIQGLRQEKRAVEDEQIDAYKQIHAQIHQLAKSTQDLAVSDKEFEALEEQYKALPALPTSLPEKLIERLDNDYSKACDAYGNANERLNQAKVDKELETLAAKAQLCLELEQLPKKAKEEEVLALHDKVKNLELNNKDYLKRIAVRLEKARDTDREEYGEARRLLLIESEILLDFQSPKEDKDLRLQIQLDRMKQQGIGNAVTNKTVAMKELKFEWMCLPGAEAKLQKEFDARYNKLLKESS